MEQAQLRATTHYKRAARYFNSKIKPIIFCVLVLRKISQSAKEKNVNLLRPNWEGPYRVVEIVRPKTYRLKDMNEIVLPHFWNAKHLRNYYQ